MAAVARLVVLRLRLIHMAQGVCQFKSYTEIDQRLCLKYRSWSNEGRKQEVIVVDFVMGI